MFDGTFFFKNKNVFLTNKKQLLKRKMNSGWLFWYRKQYFRRKYGILIGGVCWQVLTRVNTAWGMLKWT